MRTIVIAALTFILMMLLPLACSEKLSEDVITYPLSEESKTWLFEGENGDSIVFSDSTGNEQVFVFESENSYYNEKRESTDPFGWQKIIYALVESRAQYFSTNNPDWVSLKLTSGINEEDNLDIELLSINVIFYPESLELKRITIWRREDEHSRTGVSTFGMDIKSKLEYHDSISIGDKMYYEVIDFRLLDLFSNWDPGTIIEFSYGKGSGFLRYRLEDGTEYIRTGGLEFISMN